MSAQAPEAVVMVRPHHFDVNPVTAADNVFQSAEPNQSPQRAAAAYQETTALAGAFAEGIAWGEAKQVLFERLDREIAPMREVYNELVQDPARIEKTLKEGAEKARTTP